MNLLNWISVLKSMQTFCQLCFSPKKKKRKKKKLTMTSKYCLLKIISLCHGSDQSVKKKSLSSCCVFLYWQRRPLWIRQCSALTQAQCADAYRAENKGKNHNEE